MTIKRNNKFENVSLVGYASTYLTNELLIREMTMAIGYITTL
ncbi:MAG: hypothetical protein ACJAS3_002515 [Roseivirga sp.]|jgi:hypothetical protein